MVRTLAFLLLCLPVSISGAATIDAFVSVPPQRYLLQRVGGERVRVQVLLVPGQAPETFDPSARQMEQLAAAKLYFLAGVPFEHNWVGAMNKANPDLIVVPCCGVAAGDTAPGPDPHYWTSPANAMAMAQAMYTHLVAVDPARRAVYQANLDSLQADVQALDGYIRQRLAKRRINVFITAHASWGWFARDYGLTELAMEKGGREVGPRGLAELLARARREKIHTLFVQDQYRTPVVRTLAQQLDAELAGLDPLAEDYLDNLRRTADRIAGALQ